MRGNIVIWDLAALVLVSILINGDYLNAQVCPNLPAKRAAGGSYYKIEDAYNAAVDRAKIMGQGVVFKENPDLNRNISVIIRGGYDCN